MAWIALVPHSIGVELPQLDELTTATRQTWADTLDPTWTGRERRGERLTVYYVETMRREVIGSG